MTTEEKLRTEIERLAWRSMATAAYELHGARVQRIAQEQAAEFCKRGDEFARMLLHFITREDTELPEAKRWEWDSQTESVEEFDSLMKRIIEELAQKIRDNKQVRVAVTVNAAA